MATIRERVSVPVWVGGWVGGGDGGGSNEVLWAVGGWVGGEMWVGGWVGGTYRSYQSRRQSQSRGPVCGEERVGG